jgi:hypothetical protein
VAVQSKMSAASSLTLRSAERLNFLVVSAENPLGLSHRGVADPVRGGEAVPPFAHPQR